MISLARSHHAALMVQGTTSNAGKSTIVAALCRWLLLRGVKVAPFKPQNMSNNAAVTEDGGEIGRAQAFQARAAGCLPTRDMNPVLLKPLGSGSSEIIVNGESCGRVSSKDFRTLREKYLPKVSASFNRLSAQHSFCIIEGAGGAAEINLRSGDLANMGFALPHDIPVVLVCDVERGGSIASLVGTWQLLTKVERRLVIGFWINKFRGDTGLYEDAKLYLERALNRPCWGVIPWFAKASQIPAEDTQALPSHTLRSSDTVTTRQALRVGIVRLPTISNFDEFAPLCHDPSFECTWLEYESPLPCALDWLILPGSRTTIKDLARLQESGFVHDIYSHLRRGGKILGICGGYCMLAKSIHDPLGKDGKIGRTPGLGLLDVHVKLQEEKSLRRCKIAIQSNHLGRKLDSKSELHPSYEIHHAQVDQTHTHGWLVDEAGETHGTHDKQARVFGCFHHGIFEHRQCRHSFFFDSEPQSSQTSDVTESILDDLARHVAQHTRPEYLEALYNRAVI